jgi:hypothetical protein
MITRRYFGLDRNVAGRGAASRSGLAAEFPLMAALAFGL